jgi:hypothetical protein
MEVDQLTDHVPEAMAGGGKEKGGGLGHAPHQQWERGQRPVFTPNHPQNPNPSPPPGIVIVSVHTHFIAASRKLTPLPHSQKRLSKKKKQGRSSSPAAATYARRPPTP